MAEIKTQKGSLNANDAIEELFCDPKGFAEVFRSGLVGWKFTQEFRFADVYTETLQADTAKARIWLLASCWDWAEGKYHVAKENSFRGLSNRFRSQPKKPKRPFSDAQVRAILDGCRSNRYYCKYADYAAFLLGVGMRLGEAAGLSWENVAPDFTNVIMNLLC